ncbi:MAG: hypothetical protein PF542_05885 [Nanoarchaeota archaeon]|jgi:lipid-A-disaccharide synthase-like uncharacterized protein|nr:hypothetical protein [Nanoarchaeota archaeon]
MITFKIIGIIGLILIIAANILTLKKKTRLTYSYPLFTLGGIGLLIYSISINDLIFIILQAAFIVITTYETIITMKK